jgi:DUF4097 and DUF4098 domain-containing protein YvlB
LKTLFPSKFLTVLLSAVAAAGLNGCISGAGVSGGFDRSFTVKGHARLEVSGAAGDVAITGSGDGQVHIHGDVRATSMGFGKPTERLNETLANPGVEQREDTIRVGKGMSNLRNVRINYVIEIPKDTEVNVSIVSGSQSIRNIRGPVVIQAASGGIRVEGIERDVQLQTVSGAVEAIDVGGDVRASTASGGVTVTNAKGDVRASSLSGTVRVSKPAGRIDADCGSGKIEIDDARFDVKAHSVSGEVAISGDPGAQGYWDLKTVSGAVHVQVPPAANFRFSAEAISGNIKTDIPIVIEEQGKHSLHAHVGTGGGRIEVHTMSGDIIVH